MTVILFPSLYRHEFQVLQPLLGNIMVRSDLVMVCTVSHPANDADSLRITEWSEG